MLIPKIIREKRFKTLCIVDSHNRLMSIVTRRDVEKNLLFPNACKNEFKQLRVGAAVNANLESAIERATALVKAGVDVLVIDTAHGHSDIILRTIKELKKLFD